MDVSNNWQVFDLPELKAKVVGNEARIFEFLRVPSMSAAVYRLPAGSGCSHRILRTKSMSCLKAKGVCMKYL